MRSTEQPRRRVLVVEDDRAVAHALQLVLGDHGHSVVLAEGGCEALTALQQTAQLPDVILLDLAMPLMDGRTFRAVQMHHPVWRTIPVIVLSAAQRGGGVELELNASGYVAKPFAPEKLLALIDRISALPARDELAPT